MTGRAEGLRPVPSLLVAQADVLRLEHFLIRGFVAQDEVESVHGLHHGPAGGHGERPEPQAQSARTLDTGPEEQPRSAGGNTGALQAALYGLRRAACTQTQQPPRGVRQ